MSNNHFSRDVVIVGGCGRVGLPLGIAFASRGISVTLYDINSAAVEQVNSGVLPFQEKGAQELLEEATYSGCLTATTDASSISSAEHVIVVVGTPIDAYLSPDHSAIWNMLESCRQHFREGQFLVFRSTVHPGTTRLIEKTLESYGLTFLASRVAFCPERIAEGHAMTELFELPQIVAARDPQAASHVEKLFRVLTDQIVQVTPEEAEFAKLFTNTWRYIKFATANEFWRISNDAELDFERIRQAIIYEYPRAADLPGPGFAAGPCLRKDTMQLAAHSGSFGLGHIAMQINEGLPDYVIGRLEQRYPLATMSVGILGMAFKGGSDDPRDSLAFRLRRNLTLRAREVLCTDPYIDDDRFLPYDELMGRADLLVIGAPHPSYQNLSARQPIADIWGITGSGLLL